MKSLSLRKAAGDLRVRAGSSLWVRLDLQNEQVDRRMMVQNVKRSFADGEHRMDLTLEGGGFGG